MAGFELGWWVSWSLRRVTLRELVLEKFGEGIPARRSNAAGEMSVSESWIRRGCLQRWQTRGAELILSTRSGNFADFS